MAIIKWKDPLRLASQSLWPTFFSDEDFWLEDTEGLSVYETDNEAVVEANVAGVPAEKIDISFEKGVLTIKAEHQESEEKKKKKRVVYRQARQSRYFYTTSIPCPIKENEIKAEVKNGVVTVILPKKEEIKPKKIKVKAQEK